MRSGKRTFWSILMVMMIILQTLPAPVVSAVAEDTGLEVTQMPTEAPGDGTEGEPGKDVSNTFSAAGFNVGTVGTRAAGTNIVVDWLGETTEYSGELTVTVGGTVVGTVSATNDWTVTTLSPLTGTEKIVLSGDGFPGEDYYVYECNFDKLNSENTVKIPVSGTQKWTWEKVWLNTAETDRFDVTMSFNQIVSTSTFSGEVTGFKGEGKGSGDVISATETVAVPLYNESGVEFADLQFTSETGSFGKTPVRVGDPVYGENTVTVYNTVNQNITVQKRWPADLGDEGHTSVTIGLYRSINGGTPEYRYSTTVTKSGGVWPLAYFTNLPKAGRNGDTIEIYTYSVKEIAIDGDADLLSKYDPQVGTPDAAGITVVTNNRVTDPDAEIAIQIEKTWEGVFDGEAISEFTIVCNEDSSVTVDPVYLTGTSNSTTTSSVIRVPSTSGGINLTYNVKETMSTGNFISKGPVRSTTADGILWQFTNTLNETRLIAQKDWLGSESGRPDEITLYLLRDGEYVYDEFGEKVSRPMSSTDATCDFGVWPIYDDNWREYAYSVEEEAIQGYTAFMSGMSVTNVPTDEGEGIIVVVDKKWDPSIYGYREFPEVTLRLYKESDNSLVWSDTVEAGVKLNHYFIIDDVVFDPNETYYLVEVYEGEEYGNGEEAGFWRIQISNEGELEWNSSNTVGQVTAINTLIDDQPPGEGTGSQDLVINKEWVLASNAGFTADELTAEFILTVGNGAKPPSNITWAPGTPGSTYDPSTGMVTIPGNGWIVLSVPILDGNNNNIMYTLTETDNTPGFSSSMVKTQNILYEFTNRQQTTPISVSKTWEGLKLRGSIIPYSVTFAVMCRPEESNGTWTEVGRKTIANTSTNYDYTNVSTTGIVPSRNPFDLGSYPTYGFVGQTWVKLEYEVWEVASTLPDWDKFDKEDSAVIDGSASITNTYDPDKATVDVIVYKTWTGVCIMPGETFPSITVQLLADGQPATYYNGDAVGPITIGEGSGSTYQFKIENLPKFQSDKITTIVYTLEETEIGGQNLIANDGLITDTNNQGNLRDYRNESVTPVSDYDFSILNSVSVPESERKLTITAVKDWYPKLTAEEDAAYQVTFGLLQNGRLIDTKILDTTTGWKCDFGNLEIGYTYTVIETKRPSGYVVSAPASMQKPTETDENGNLSREVGLLNSYTTETYDIKFIKEWEGDEDYSEEMKALLRGSVNLVLDDGSGTGSTITVPMAYNSQSGDWEGKENLPAVNGTEPIVYKVSEIIPVNSNYVFGGLVSCEGRAIEGSAIDTFTISIEENAGDGTVTVKNVIKPATVSVEGMKTWEDAGFGEYRPESLTVVLERKLPGESTWRNPVTYTVGGSGSTVDSYSMDGNVWTWTVEGLDEYDLTAEVATLEAATYEYRWSEVGNVPEYYMTSGDGVVLEALADGEKSLVNVFKTIPVTVTKTWDLDAYESVTGDSVAVTPSEVAIILQRKVGDDEDTVFNADPPSGVISTPGGIYGEYTFNDLPQYNPDGEEYTYYVLETTDLSGNNFETEEIDLDVTNTLIPISIDVTKDWGNATDIPDAIEVTLEGWVEGIATPAIKRPAIILNDDNNWTDVFRNLPKYHFVGNEPKLITYTVTESGAEAFDLQNAIGTTGTAKYTVQVEPAVTGNTYSVVMENERRMREIEGVKTWANDTADDRPGSVVLTLERRAGTTGAWTGVGQITVTKDNWIWKGETTARTSTATSWSWGPIEVEDAATDGIAFEYQIVENQSATGMPTDFASAYTKAESDLNVINTFEQVTLKITKIWSGESVEDRPALEDIEVTVQGSDSETYTKTLAEWEAGVTVPKYALNAAKTAYALIQYTVVDNSETGAEGYAFTIDKQFETPDADAEEYNAEVENTILTTQLSVTKKWLMADDTAETYYTWVWHPETVTIQLRRKTIASGGNAATDDDVTALYANTDSGWLKDSGTGLYTRTFTGLPTHDKFNREYMYYVTETPVPDGFATPAAITDLSDENGFAYEISNKLLLKNISGVKQWGVGTNPTVDYQSVRLTLTGTISGQAPGQEETVFTKTTGLTWDGNLPGYTFQFTNVPEYDYSGVTPAKITYTITETGEGMGKYAMKIVGGKVEPGQSNVVLQNDYPMAAVTGTKTWNHGGLLEAYQPTQITVNVYRSTDGVQTGNVDAYLYASNVTVTVGADNTWTTPMYPLREDATGKEYTYWATEVPMAGYTPGVSGAHQFTNTFIPVSLTVTKAWDEPTGTDYDYEASRPDSIKITITGTAGGNTVYTDATATLDRGVGWSHTYNNLPRYAYVSGTPTPITYTVSETKPAGYALITVEGDRTVTVASTTGASLGTITLTNKLEPTSVYVKKVWKDDGDYMAETRPPSITINLMRSDDTVNPYDTATISYSTDPDTQVATFTDLSAYDSEGNPYSYTVAEVAVIGYTTVGPATSTQTGYDFAYEITNTLDTVNITGIKSWIGDSGAGFTIRPSVVTVVLERDGVDYPGHTTTVAADGTWSFTGLPKINLTTGAAYAYTVREEYVHSTEKPHYTTTIVDGVITNTLVPTTLVITKRWVDESGSTRPTSITFEVVGTGTKDGNADTELYRAQHTMPQPQFDLEASWPALTITGLPKYDETGTDVKYTVREILPDLTYGPDAPSKVATVAAGSAYQYCSFTNTFGLLDLSGGKTWHDYNNAYSTRPDSIQVELWRSVEGENGEAVPGVATQTAGAPSWSWTFPAQPETRESDGKPYTYYVVEKEVNIGDLDNYETAYAETGVGMNLVNTLMLDIPVRKVWDDEDNRFEKRPASVTIGLYQDEGTVPVRSVTLSDDNNWDYVFTDLPAATDGVPHTYTVKEDMGGTMAYRSVITGNVSDGFVVTNTLNVMDIPVEKLWADDGNAHATRPDGLNGDVITIKLLRDGTEIRSVNLPTEDTTNPWAYVFEDVPIANDLGTAYAYSIEEVAYPGYTSRITLGENGWTGDAAKAGFAVTNTLNIMDIPVTKAWKDNDNYFGTRPESITVTLYQDGNPYDSLTLPIDGQDDPWTGVFEDVPISTANGQHVYTVDESVVYGYTKKIETNGDSYRDGFIITNTLDTVDRSGEKTWSDYNDSYEMRPASVEIQLQYRTEGTGWVNVPGVETQVAVAEYWAWSFTGLPACDAAGNTYEYGVAEVNGDPRYEATYTDDNPMSLTNTLKLKTLYVVKEWVGDTDYASTYRPGAVSITVRGSDGTTYSGNISRQSNGTWYALFVVPAVDAEGNNIDYTLEETVPAGYRLVSNTGFVYNESTGRYDATLQNELITVTASVTKRWSGASLSALNVHLYADGVLRETYQLTTGNWSHTFGPLPRYRANSTTEITYTITETVPANFTLSSSRTVTDGNVTVILTNTYYPPVTEPPVTPTPTPSATPTPTPRPSASPSASPSTSPSVSPSPSVEPSPIPTLEPGATPTPPPYTTEEAPPVPELPEDTRITRILTILDENIPLGAGINLNLGDCFD